MFSIEILKSEGPSQKLNIISFSEDRIPTQGSSLYELRLTIGQLEENISDDDLLEYIHECFKNINRITISNLGLEKILEYTKYTNLLRITRSYRPELLQIVTSVSLGPENKNA